MSRWVRQVTLISALGFLLCGCVATADPTELNWPLHEPLVNGRVVTVEVFHVNGQDAPGEALHNAITTFSKYVAGEVLLVEGVPYVLGTGADGLIRDKQLELVLEQRRHRGPSAIAILLTPGLSDVQQRGSSVQQEDGARVIVIQAKWIDKSVPLLAGRRKWWESVIMRELCRALGVPSDRGHARAGRHCTRSDCVLFGGVGSPTDLCELCQAEIRAAQQAAAGKLIGPDEPYALDRTLDEMVRLNQDDPRAYAYRARVYFQRKQYAKAIEDVNKLVELRSESPAPYFSRGMIYVSMGQREQGIADFSRAIELAPNLSVAYRRRGDAYYGARAYDLAVADYSKSLELTPNHVATYSNRGRAYAKSGKYQLAISDYEQCLKLRVASPDALNGLAWLLATCPVDQFRDGPRALELAWDACEGTNWQHPYVLDTLAAAFAQCEQFDKAIEYQSRAIELGLSKDAAEFRSHLELYRAHRPWREADQ